MRVPCWRAKKQGERWLERYDIASGGSGFHQALLLLSFFYAHAKKAIDYLEKQLPSAVFSNPLSDETEAVVEIPASKKLLPQMFDRTERKLEKNDYYLIAEQMTESEIHRDIISVLDAIAALLPQKDSNSHYVGQAGGPLPLK